MQTEHILITDPTEQATDIRRAACIIQTGGLVVFPTETVYGLGGDATNADASRRIYAAKGRPSDNPLIIHGFPAGCGNVRRYGCAVRPAG